MGERRSGDFSASAYLRKEDMPAAPTAATSEAADGWIKWDGGECPVASATLVDIEFERGPASVNPSTAGGWDWAERGAYGIVAYRVVEVAA